MELEDFFAGWLLVFLIIILHSPDVFALGGEAGQPEVTIFGGVADDGSLIAVGIIDPNPLSDRFISLEDPLLGVVHSNDLWFAAYVPSSVGKDELVFTVEYWKEKTVKTERALEDGTVEVTTGTVKYDEKTETLTIPARDSLYLETRVIKNHKNLTHVRVTYQNLEWEFLHQSTPAAQSVSWVHNLGDVWFLYLKATFITMIVALISFAFGSWIFEKVRYVPPLSFLETGIAGFFLIMALGASYGWLEYHALSYRWYIMQLPVMGIVTFLSLQYFKPDKRRVLGLRIPPQRDGPDIELAVSAPLIVRNRKGDTVNDDILVHRWSWKNVLYRLLTNGPKVVYELHQKFHTKDINKVFDDVYILHPEFPPCFEYPHLEIRWTKIGFLPVPYPYLVKGVAVMYLAPRYSIDVIHVMADLEVINDNNTAREEAEKELFETKVKIQRKSTEKAYTMIGVIEEELFGKEKEEPEKEEKPEEEVGDKEVDDLADAEKKKEEDEKK